MCIDLHCIYSREEERQVNNSQLCYMRTTIFHGRHMVLKLGNCIATEAIKNSFCHVKVVNRNAGCSNNFSTKVHFLYHLTSKSLKSI